MPGSGTVAWGTRILRVIHGRDARATLPKLHQDQCFCPNKVSPARPTKSRNLCLLVGSARKIGPILELSCGCLTLKQN